MIYISSQKKVVERIVIKICLTYSNWQEVSRSTLFSLIRLSFSFCLAGKSTAFTPGSEIRLLLYTKSQKKSILQWCLFGFHRPMKKNKCCFRCHCPIISLIRLSFSFCLAGKSTAFTPGSEIRLLLYTKSQKKNIMQWCLFGFHRPMKKNKCCFRCHCPIKKNQ